MVAKPLIVRTADGVVLDLVHTDEKGFKKSLEHGRLWIRHQQTDRLLPYQGPETPVGAKSHHHAESGVFESLVEKEGWFEATIPEADGETGARHATGRAAEARDSKDADDGEQVGPEEVGDVLSRLERIIAGRKAELPAGSYTTYLFQQGLTKIRKKTGEEAVELVLAADAGETVSESADFLYHLLVLLAALDIPFSRVIGELTRRFEK